jgi:hypothetical protein
VQELLANGRIIDLALVVVGLELTVLLVVRQRSRAGLKPIDLIGQLAAGVMLMLALRCALTGADYHWTWLFLTASFPAHVFDLVRRARRARANHDSHQAA